MIKELDSAEIIAFCVKKKHKSDMFEISYHQIQCIGRMMEKEMPTLLVTSDMVSIDAFRCEFSQYVEMRKNILRINRIHEIYSRIERFLPEATVVAKMEEMDIEL